MKRFIITRALLVLTLAFLTTSEIRADGDEQDASLLAVNMQVENLRNPIGVGALRPRLSWASRPVSNRDAHNKKQTAYQILVCSSPATFEEDNGDLWDSGKVQSEDSLYIEYDGKPLQTFQQCFWKVRVWDEDGDVGPWSNGGFWIQGVVDEKDWKAQWIGQPESARPDVDLKNASWISAQDEKETDAGYAVEYFRKKFTIDLPQAEFDAQNVAGTIYYAACQKFEIFVNGAKVGYSIGMVFNPDQLRSIDVSEYLKSGENVVAFVVSNDTKRPNGTKFGDGTLYPTALVSKLVVRTLDKTDAPSNLPTPNRFGKPKDLVVEVGTDSSWKASLAGGDNWNSLEFDDSSWKDAKVAFDDLDKTPWGKLRRRAEFVSPCFQKEFTIKKRVVKAALAVCAPGLFEAYLNGSKIGNQVLTPSFTRYDRRLLYNVFDVTDEFQKYPSPDYELQFVLGHSWYDVRSIVTWNFDAAPWRDFPRLLAQLEIIYDDGSKETIATDPTWTYSTSPVLFDCVRQGEIVDGNWNREILGNVAVVPAPLGNPKLVAQKNPLTRVQREYVAKSVSKVGDKWVVDMGENNAGWTRIRLHGQKKGDVIRFKYSERVVESGEIERRDIEMHFMEGTPAYLTGYKGGFQTDFYFCNGEEEEFFEPRFTYNGYQYIEVVGLREEPKVEDFQGRRVNSDFLNASSFTCSNDLLNKLQNAAIRSYQNNFVAGYPTDCPHREKNGWTGDAQLACELAQYNFENTAGYEKWLDDLCDEQKANGDICAIVPTGDWGYPWGNGPAWDSSLVMIPWYVYVYRGDKRILETSYESMKKYVDYMTSRERDNGLLYHGLGDWVYAKTNTPVEVTSTGYYYLDTKIVAQTAKILGKEEDYQKYSKLAERIRSNYNAALYKGNGVYSINSQTSQSCAIHQGFARALDQADRDAVFARLCETVANANGHFDVGILGAKYILRSLSEGGRTDLALQLMLQETKPAMADWIRRGAGTLWEDWGEGSSRNHIMFGDFSAWMFQSLAGIKLDDAPDSVVAEVEPENVAFKHFVVEPKCSLADTTAPGFDPITSVRAFIEIPYGPILVDWKWNDEKTELTARIGVPVNTTATIVLPCGETQKSEVTRGAEGVALSDAPKPNTVTYEVGSGLYEFKISAK